LSFHARKGSAKAEMRAPSEGEMAIVLAREVETVRIGKAFRVAIACAHDGDDSLTFADLFATECEIEGGESSCVLAGAFVAKQFFHSASNQRKVIMEPPHFVRMTEQRKNAVADEVGGRFQTTD
jgi:hypothetical protein